MSIAFNFITCVLSVSHGCECSNNQLNSLIMKQTFSKTPDKPNTSWLLPSQQAQSHLAQNCCLLCSSFLFLAHTLTDIALSCHSQRSCRLSLHHYSLLLISFFQSLSAACGVFSCRASAKEMFSVLVRLRELMKIKKWRLGRMISIL